MATLSKAGRYDLREELGRGAMGVVYHGFDPVIGRDVAVKTLHLSEAGTGMSREELVSRFQTEARAAGVLTHPNIVVVYDAGEEDGLFYITMEFVEGKSLQSLIDSHSLFPVPRVMKIMEQVCSALDFAHQHGVVHRDVKPANLVLTPDDTVKITDFGTAKILQFGTAQTAHVMGTPSYMSPEQVKGKPVDGRTDIFSLGVILYELLTGEKPFPGQNITTVIYKIINEEPIPPRSLDSSIHPGLSAVITRALAKDPAARYQNCQEFLSALKSYHEQAKPETTGKLTPSALQPAPGAAATVTPAARAGNTLLPRATDAELLAYSHLAAGGEEEAPKKRPSILLTLALLGVIGYAGYRVYPPLLDIWQRARETSPAPASPGVAHSAAAPNIENSAAKPEAQSETTPQDSASSPSSVSPPEPIANSAEPAAPQTALPSPPKVVEPEPSATDTPGRAPAAIPKSVLPPPSPAKEFEVQLRSELSGMPLADKLKTAATRNTLTLSGSLTLAEHRELLAHLRSFPPAVRIVDDTEFAEGQAASASTGWVWVRSSPPGARIVVDGEETGQLTPSRLELQQGEHIVSLVRRGFGVSHRKVAVNSGEMMQFTEFLTVE